MPAGKKNYKTLKAELDELLAWFEADDLDIDEAVKKYQAAIDLTKALDDHLSSAKNTLTDLQAKITS